MQQIKTDKRGFNTPVTPIGAAGMQRFAVDFDANMNDILNGLQAIDRLLFTAPTELTLASDVLSAPTLAFHTVKAETGTTDTLSSLGASNQRFVVLKAKTGHTIGVKHGVSNINIPGGANVSLSGNRTMMLWCDSGQWSAVGLSAPYNNVAATVDPGSSDDANSGYSPNSLWVNTTLDRVWVCVDSTTGAAIWRWISPKKNAFSIRAADTAFVGIGVAVSVASGSPANANDATNTFVSETVATIGTNVGIATSTLNVVRLDHNPIIEFTLKTSADITAQRIWMGLSTAVPNAADALTAGIKYVGFRFSTTASDGGWVPLLNDGATQAVGTAIGIVAINTVYKLRVRVDSANARAYFSVNDGAEQVFSTNFPAITTEFAVVEYLQPTAAVSKTININGAEVAW